MKKEREKPKSKIKKKQIKRLTKRRQKKAPEKLKDEPESMMKSKLVIHKGKEVVQGQEYKRLELVMTENLGLIKLELKSKTEVKKLNVTKVERRAMIDD